MTRSYDEIYSQEVARFDSEDEAWVFAETEDQRSPHFDQWHEVRTD